MARRKAPEKGEQLHRAYLAVLESSSVDQLSTLLGEQQQFIRFLNQQPDFRGQAAAALDGYQESMVAAHGMETNAMTQVSNLRIELARTLQEEARNVEELVRVEESLSGTTSRPYMQAIQRLAGAQRAIGNSDRALSLDLQAIHIADLTSAPNDFQRFQTRINVASTLAFLQRFDEAEQLAADALVIAKQMHPPQDVQVTNQIENIRRQKETARAIVH